MSSNLRSEEYEVRAFRVAQTKEYDAWLDVVRELGRLGIAEINAGEPHERLHDLITLWGEELVQLRMADPNPVHAGNALIKRRKKVHGDE